MDISLYTKKEKREYAEYLIHNFGGHQSAIEVIDEMLKICPEGSLVHDLKDVQKIIRELL
jgi:hypothetical protein